MLIPNILLIKIYEPENISVFFLNGVGKTSPRSAMIWIETTLSDTAYQKPSLRVFKLVSKILYFLRDKKKHRCVLFICPQGDPIEPIVLENGERGRSNETLKF